MKQSRNSKGSTFRFVLAVQDPTLKDPQVQGLLAKATRDAAKAAGLSSEGLKISTELEGGFGGLGEATVIMAVWHVAKAVGVAAGLGASSAAGKMFFEAYLAPRLRKLNLLPSELHPIKTQKKQNRPTRKK